MQQLLFGQPGADETEVIEDVFIAGRNTQCSTKLLIRGIEVGVPDMRSSDQYVNTGIVRLLAKDGLTQRQCLLGITSGQSARGLGKARIPGGLGRGLRVGHRWDQQYCEQQQTRPSQGSTWIIRKNSCAWAARFSCSSLTRVV